jgi:hypothetical protein
MYRVVPGSIYLMHFASDRSHMKTSNGRWMVTPPALPPIQTEGELFFVILWDIYGIFSKKKFI